MLAFDQVVAEQTAFREAAGKNSAEGAQIVDPFAVVGALAGEILVHVGNRFGVWIDPDRVGKQPAERRSQRAGQGWTDARLEDGIGAGQDPALFIKPGPVERMGKRLDHPPRGSRRQLGVAVERDDEADALEPVRISHLQQLWGAFRPGIFEVLMQFLEFSAFALPADVASFRRTPLPFAMEEEETLAVVPPVQLLQSLDGLLQELSILWLMRRIRIFEI